MVRLSTPIALVGLKENVPSTGERNLDRAFADRGSVDVLQVRDVRVNRRLIRQIQSLNSDP